jgi:hypothetical protein
MINTLRTMFLGAVLGIGVAGCSSDAPPAAPNSNSNVEQGNDADGSGSTTEPAEPAKGSGSSN